MPKDKKRHSRSCNKSRPSPYSSSDKVVNPLSKKSLDSVEDVKEWEEARCPVCMEHPHNAVLLLCSSHKKGCHPYMCDTSRRHSNCLDQFRKSFAATPESPSQDETETLQSNTVTRGVSHRTVQRSRDLEVLSDQTPSPPDDDKTQLKLACPLCRGEVTGWVVVERARRFMNAKTRSCACETCDFTGTYPDLRKHARVQHPQARPSEADPERQRDWRRMEQERDLMDVLSTIQSTFAEERDDVSVVSLRLFFIFSRLSEAETSSEGGSQSRTRVQLRRRSRRSPVTVTSDDFHIEMDSDSEEEDSFDIDSSPGYSPSHEQGGHQRNQR